jgi:hypothetical protein
MTIIEGMAKACEKNCNNHPNWYPAVIRALSPAVPALEEVRTEAYETGFAAANKLAQESDFAKGIRAEARRAALEEVEAEIRSHNEMKNSDYFAALVAKSLPLR